MIGMDGERGRESANPILSALLDDADDYDDGENDSIIIIKPYIYIDGIKTMIKNFNVHFGIDYSNNDCHLPWSLTDIQPNSINYLNI